MKSLLLSIVAMLSLMQFSYASTPFTVQELLDNYFYAVEVQWDQQDQSFLQEQEEIFASGLKVLLSQGESPEKLLNESLVIIPDERFKRDVIEALKFGLERKIPTEDFINIILTSAQKSQVRGAQWSPLAKIAVGVAVTLLVSRIAVEIYFHYWERRF